MAKRRIILTQSQLDEIVGGNTEYLDGENTDFSQYDGINNIYTGEKLDSKDADPVDTDKIAHQMVRKPVAYGLLHRGTATYNPLFVCARDRGEKKSINETNSELVNTKFGIGDNLKNNMSAVRDSAGANAVKNGSISYDNAKTIKSRMNKLQQRAKKGDMAAQRTYERMGGKVLQDTVEKNLDNATSLVKRDKENRANLGFKNVYQKPGATKVSGNGKAHTPKNNNGIIITYN